MTRFTPSGSSRIAAASDGDGKLAPTQQFLAKYSDGESGNMSATSKFSSSTLPESFTCFQ